MCVRPLSRRRPIPEKRRFAHPIALAAVIVRCGRCRAELEVSGPGEFICPSCGTRNAVRQAPGGSPFGMAPGGSGLTLPGGAPAPASKQPGEQAGVNWIVCGACSYRFAIGVVEKVTCPNCRADVEPPPGEQQPPS